MLPPKPHSVLELRYLDDWEGDQVVSEMGRRAGTAECGRADRQQQIPDREPHPSVDKGTFPTWTAGLPHRYDGCPWTKVDKQQ